MEYDIGYGAEHAQKRYDFVGVGGLAYDIVMRVPRLPLKDEKYPAELIGKLPGGFIANATCAAARLGLRTGFIGWAGNDPEGQWLADDFRQWTVDPAGLVAYEGEVTPFTVVITDHSGARSIVLPGSPLYNMPLTYEQLAVARQARVIYSFPRDAQWVMLLKRAALDSRALLALDVETAVPMRGKELRDVVELADIVFLTENSLKLMKASGLHKMASDRQWIIMTAGARGASGIAPGLKKPVFQPAMQVPVVDSTGAGDCFHAALIAARLNGADLPEALAFAAAAASLSVGHHGARGGLPTREQVEAALRRV